MLWLLPSVPPSPLPPCLHSSLLPHHSSGRPVDWKEERLVPGGPAEWRCSLSKGALQVELLLQSSGFLAEYHHLHYLDISGATSSLPSLSLLVPDSSLSASLCRILIGQACLRTCTLLSSHQSEGTLLESLTEGRLRRSSAFLALSPTAVSSTTVQQQRLKTQ